ncbi:serrate RNA effector molecule homolog isoform X4 [Cryptotermes secundus]|uniref:serrate RNA effector molecule homolog isoform X4 n=1 Tax=Cryptotermes secundus TaxID=105785 RepID=UPI000CD7C296|nr:serrate RNA effector molecule homolog isoform X4 [Cryptotermes secundus]
MGDSEDEYDRKRRDKFRGERTESYQRGEGRRGGGGEDRRREEWIEREERRSAGYGHDSAAGGYGSYASSWPHDSYSSQHAYGNHGNNQREMQTAETQPPMMSFKAYLQTQDDNITDDEAIRKYNEYKLEFKRQQLNEFFVTHKEEEWFKIKYHPEDSVKRKDEQMTALKNRVKVFMEFMEQNRLDKVSVDADQSEQLIRLLDAVVIRLEGGTDYDLLALDEPRPATSASGQGSAGPGSNQTSKAGTVTAGQVTEKQGSGDAEVKAGSVKEEEEEEPKPFILGEDEDTKKKERDKATESSELKKDPSQPLKLTISSEQVELQKKAKEFLKQKSAEEEDAPMFLFSGQSKKRKREYEYESGSESGDEPLAPGDNNGMEEDEPPPPGLEEGKGGDDSYAEDEDKNRSKKMDISDDKEDEDEDAKKEDKSDDREDNSDKEGKDKSVKTLAEDGKVDSGDDAEEGVEGDETERECKKKRGTSEEAVKPRPLHKTASIFLRNLAPTITKQEVEAMCKRYPGFLRVAIADPQPERRWFRRGWVTFERQVNIKEICWNLNNIRLRDCELGAIVNRDLSRRIRTVNGITSHRQVVRHDIKLSARIVHNLDAKAGLWVDPDSPEAKGEFASEGDAKKTKEKEPHQMPLPSFGLVSKNPVLKNITDYLIEEASAEEEELLGHTADQEEGQLGDDTATVERDEALIKVLDRLLFYLRIVHSVDYYNHCEYPNEDEMPNRCGIMHARGIPPSSKLQVTQQEISDYCRTFEQKIASFLQPATKITDEEYSKLGHKDPDVEVEKFIQANTQELAKDKWLCPLSGKKFKGPEFVRKHIFNKHAEKVDEVKKEVEYFNNYLRDPKRPQLAEHPGNRHQRKDGASERESFSAPAPYVPHYQYNYGGRHAGYGGHNYGGGYGYNTGYNQGYSRPSRGGFNRGRFSSNDSANRPVIAYSDLDVPDMPEII